MASGRRHAGKVVSSSEYVFDFERTNLRETWRPVVLFMLKKRYRNLFDLGS